MGGRTTENKVLRLLLLVCDRFLALFQRVRGYPKMCTKITHNIQYMYYVSRSLDPSERTSTSRGRRTAEPPRPLRGLTDNGLP